MKRLALAIRRALAWHWVRRLEIELHSQEESLEMVRHPKTREAIRRARKATQSELAKARGDYIALLPVGRRMTFKVA